MIQVERFTGSAWPHFTGMLAVLTLVAWLSPMPYPTDQAIMERVGQGVIVPGCADLNCFRILVPATLEALPGSSTLRWRGFAVVANAGAAIAAAYLALALGLSAAGATWTAWLAATGAGSFATVHHPYNADPFVLLLAPVVTALLLRNRMAPAGIIATVGIFAKEFGAAALYISAAAAAFGRRWRQSMRQFLLAFAVTGVWLVWQVWLMAAFDYSYNDNPSSKPLSGGYLRLWLMHVTPLSGAAAVFGAFGAVYLLLPAGWSLAPARLRQLALGAIPAIAALVYVATPERAVWNFFFLVLPIAALVLERAATPIAVALIASLAIANLRIGGQIVAAPGARYPAAVAVVMALIAIWQARSSRPGRPTTHEA